MAPRRRPAAVGWADGVDSAGAHGGGVGCRAHPGWPGAHCTCARGARAGGRGPGVAVTARRGRETSTTTGKGRRSGRAAVDRYRGPVGQSKPTSAALSVGETQEDTAIGRFGSSNPAPRAVPSAFRAGRFTSHSSLPGGPSSECADRVAPAASAPHPRRCRRKQRPARHRRLPRQSASARRVCPAAARPRHRRSPPGRGRPHCWRPPAASHPRLAVHKWSGLASMPVS